MGADKKDMFIFGIVAVAAIVLMVFISGLGNTKSIYGEKDTLLGEATSNEGYRDRDTYDLKSFNDRHLLAPPGYHFEKSGKGAVLVAGDPQPDSQVMGDDISCTKCTKGTGTCDKKGLMGYYSCESETGCTPCDMIIKKGYATYMDGSDGGNGISDAAASFFRYGGSVSDCNDFNIAAPAGTTHTILDDGSMEIIIPGTPGEDKYEIIRVNCKCTEGSGKCNPIYHNGYGCAMKDPCTACKMTTTTSPK